MQFRCAHCGRKADRPTGEVNRARKSGLRLFCNRVCAGLERRKHKTKTQRVAEKRAYDAEYRQLNRAILKAKKAAHHKRSYDPVKAAAHRKTRMPYHVEYCRQPKYRAYKRKYDLQYRAKEYGPFAAAYMLVLDLNREIKSRMTNYEISIENHTFNKRQTRARAEASQATRDRHRAA